MESYLIAEYEAWKCCHVNSNVEIIVVAVKCNEDGRYAITVSLQDVKAGCFQIVAPDGYPERTDGWFIESLDPSLNMWCNSFNVAIMDSSLSLSYGDVLSLALKLINAEMESRKNSAMEVHSDDDDDDVNNERDEDSEDDMFAALSDNDGGFIEEEGIDFDTDTFWEIAEVQLRKRWSRKEESLRSAKRTEDDLKRKVSNPLSVSDSSPNASKVSITSTSSLSTLIAPSKVDFERSGQIFSIEASSKCLMNDLVHILRNKSTLGFSADAVDDNPYHWRVRMWGFKEGSDLFNQLADLESRYPSCDAVEIDLFFEMDLFPFYPPSVKLIRPRFNIQIMNFLSSMDMFKLSYWHPARNMRELLCSVKDVIQEHAIIHLENPMNDPENYPEGAYTLLEEVLIALAIVSEETPRAHVLFGMELERAAAVNVGKKLENKSYKKGWRPGVGYGSSNYEDNWNISKSTAAQLESDRRISEIINSILHILHEATANTDIAGTASFDDYEDSDMHSLPLSGPSSLFDTLDSSALIPFLENQLSVDSLIEWARHNELYMSLLNLVEANSAVPTLVPLLGPLEGQNPKCSLFSLMKRLSSKAHNFEHIIDNSSGITSTVTTNNRTPESIELQIVRRIKATFLHISTVLPTRLKNMANMAFETCFISESATDEDSEAWLAYSLSLKKLQFGTVSELPDSRFFKESVSLSKPKRILAIAQDLDTMSSSLPFCPATSIFVRSCENVRYRCLAPNYLDIGHLASLIIGPEGTPYANGVYIFDTFFPADYPDRAPKVLLARCNTSGDSVRMNPNLYACGKVCLSLLGTWPGQKSEGWIPGISTFLQVLVSIQALILVDEPYFNEPGYERSMDTASGNDRSFRYNKDIVGYNIRHAMLDQLRNPPNAFRDVIQRHFYHRKDAILQQCHKWDQKYGSLSSNIKTLEVELHRLTDPDK